MHQIPFGSRRSLALVLFCLLCLPAAPLQAEGPGAALVPPVSLDSALDRALGVPALRGGIVGAVVQRVGDGTVLYARNSDTRLTPASNRKLFTSAAALALLGSTFTFKTEVRTSAKPAHDGTLQGDISLRGAGDSLLSPDDMEELAAAVRAAGVTRIEGRVIGDGSIFQDGPYGEGWEWDDLPYYYAPQIAGLEVSRGVLAVHVTAGETLDAPVRVAVDQPTQYLPIVSTATTGPAGSPPDQCDISRPRGRNLLLVTGTLPLGGKADGLVTVEDPARYAATVFRETLQRRGVTVTGAAVSGTTPETASFVLATHTSLPMAEYIARMNKPSDNLLAESLIRVLGAVKGKGGTYAAGHVVENKFFGSLGLDTGGFDFIDGSGLAQSDVVTPHTITSLLIAMHRRPDWAAYYASLPIAGVDGSLRDRMKGTLAVGNLHAKTGSLRSVSSLSGYVTSAGGHLYAFSLLINNYPGSSEEVHAAEDRFAVVLAMSH